jgi:hypothetical protein
MLTIQTYLPAKEDIIAFPVFSPKVRSNVPPWFVAR